MECRSPTKISPVLGVSRPPSRCIIVLLPQPLGPVTATNSLSAMSRRHVLQGVDAAFRRAVISAKLPAGGWQQWSSCRVDSTRAGTAEAGILTRRREGRRDSRRKAKLFSLTLFLFLRVLRAFALKFRVLLPRTRRYPPCRRGRGLARGEQARAFARPSDAPGRHVHTARSVARAVGVRDRQRRAGVAHPPFGSRNERRDARRHDSGGGAAFFHGHDGRPDRQGIPRAGLGLADWETRTVDAPPPAAGRTRPLAHLAQTRDPPGRRARPHAAGGRAAVRARRGAVRAGAGLPGNGSHPPDPGPPRAHGAPGRGRQKSMARTRVATWSSSKPAGRPRSPACCCWTATRCTRTG